MITQEWKVTFKLDDMDACEMVAEDDKSDATLADATVNDGEVAPKTEEHTVVYKCSPLLGKTTLTVDGEQFSTKGKAFGIGLKRQELVLVGNNRGLLDIDSSGKATLIIQNATIEVVGRK